MSVASNIPMTQYQSEDPHPLALKIFPHPLQLWSQVLDV